MTGRRVLVAPCRPMDYRVGRWETGCFEMAGLFGEPGYGPLRMENRDLLSCIASDLCELLST